MAAYMVSDYSEAVPAHTRAARVPVGLDSRLTQVAAIVGAGPLLVKFVQGFADPDQLGRAYMTDAWKYIELHGDLAGERKDLLPEVFMHECGHHVLGHLRPVGSGGKTGDAVTVPAVALPGFRAAVRERAEREAQAWAEDALRQFVRSQGPFLAWVGLEKWGVPK